MDGTLSVGTRGHSAPVAAEPMSLEQQALQALHRPSLQGPGPTACQGQCVAVEAHAAGLSKPPGQTAWFPWRSLHFGCYSTSPGGVLLASGPATSGHSRGPFCPRARP